MNAPVGSAAAQGVPRPAATLILVRPSDDGPQILLMKRSAGARFMPNAHVFAGGAVDTGDSSADVYALSLHLDDQQASSILKLPSQGLAFYVAAIRETFEECGLMLAYDAAGALVDLTTWTDAQLHRARADLGSGACGLADLCRRHGWNLAVDQLYYFAHWVTPVGLPQRFDTRFFIARAPERQLPSLASAEMSELIWRTPRAALRDHAEGRLMLMRATLATLGELANFNDCDALFEFARTAKTISVTLPNLGGDVQPVAPHPNLGDAS
jgi:8-oxo-dGTP pyrophosphatase MutT (NUDIX family)